MRRQSVTHHSTLPAHLALVCCIGLHTLSATTAFAQTTRRAAFDAATLPSDVPIGRVAGAVHVSHS